MSANPQTRDPDIPETSLVFDVKPGEEFPDEVRWRYADGREFVSACRLTLREEPTVMYCCDYPDGTRHVRVVSCQLPAGCRRMDGTIQPAPAAGENP